MITAVIKRFFAKNCTDSAIILSYTTLLTLVPILFLSLSVFSISDYFNGYRELVSSFIFESLLPEHSSIAQKYINIFIDQARQLKGVGIMFLVITALLLLFEIDKRINLIWGNDSKRHWLRGGISYIAVLLFGPFFLALSLIISSYLLKMDITGIGTWVSAWVPFLLSTLGYSLLYYFVPVAKIKFKYALLGGAFAAILFTLLKYLLALYISYFPTYELIYGTLAALPILILWIYLSWITLLLGASYTFCLGKK